MQAFFPNLAVLYSAYHNSDISWVVVKVVCDIECHSLAHTSGVYSSYNVTFLQ